MKQELVLKRTANCLGFVSVKSVTQCFPLDYIRTSVITNGNCNPCLFKSVTYHGDKAMTSLAYRKGGYKRTKIHIQTNSPYLY